MNDTNRADYTAGLRALADLLDANPDAPLPYDGTTSPITIFAHERDELIATAKALPGKWDKTYDDGVFGFNLEGNLHGLTVKVYGKREQVCERVVVGTKTVTVPARPAVEATPEQTITVEDVEWRCQPLLADGDPIPVSVLADDEAGVLR